MISEAAQTFNTRQKRKALSEILNAFLIKTETNRTVNVFQMRAYQGDS